MAHVLAHLSDREKTTLCQNSIERVINTTLKNLERLEDRYARSALAVSEADHEELLVNLEDWKELRRLTVALWNNARDEVVIESMNRNIEEHHL